MTGLLFLSIETGRLMMIDIIAFVNFGLLFE